MQCNTNTQKFTKSGSVWIGMGSYEEGLFTHMHCHNAQLSGSNSVPVHTTLFLLSYGKVLASIIVAFPFTSLEAENISPLVWLHDRNLRFLQESTYRWSWCPLCLLYSALFLLPCSCSLPQSCRKHTRGRL